MRSLIRPLFIQLLVGALAARAEDYPSTVRLDIWIPIDTDAISMNAAEWDGRWVIREQWEEYSRYWCPRKGFRKIGDIRMDTDSVEDLSIYFDPFSERYIRVKVGHLVYQRLFGFADTISARPLAKAKQHFEESTLST